MTFSSSGIVEVARSREKFDGQPTIDLAAVERADGLSHLVGDIKNEPPKNKKNLGSFRALSLKKRNIVIAVIVVCAVVIVPAYTDQIFRGSTIAHGVTVSDVQVGGTTMSAARTKLTKASSKAINTPLVFVLGKDRISISSQDLDLRYDISATLHKAQDVGDSYNPLWTIGGFLRRYSVGQDIDPVVKYNQKKLDAVVTSLVNEFSRGRADAGVTITGTKVNVIKPKSGTGISRKQAEAALISSVADFSRSTHTLRSEKSEAQISLAEAEKTAAIIRTMLKENSQISTPAGNTVTITPEQLSQALVITPQGSKLILSVDSTILRASLAAQLGAVEVAPTDASFAVNGSSVGVIPSIPGKQIDFASALVHWINGEHIFAASVINIEPTRNTEWAQKLNITETVSSYTTNFPAGQERIKNIRRAAEVVNNTVVVPGETFSLNDKLGRRTAENGYVKAPVYSDKDGFFEDYGGGASQFSTTFFNAVFVGGYKDVAHSPHSIYISRYPKGRDATLNYGSIDMKFKNDSNSGMLIRTSVGATSVTVVVYGNKEGRVVTLEGPVELSRTEIGTKYTDDPNMDIGKEKETHVGYPGIVVENYRTVDRPGQPGKKETYRWTYSMVPREVNRGTRTPVAAAP